MNIIDYTLPEDAGGMNIGLRPPARYYDWNMFDKAEKRLKNRVGIISINDGAYLGLNVTVLESVSIGKNCIVGANSLVNNDLPDNVIAYGVPCIVRG